MLQKTQIRNDDLVFPYQSMIEGYIYIYIPDRQRDNRLMEESMDGWNGRMKRWMDGCRI